MLLDQKYLPGPETAPPNKVFSKLALIYGASAIFTFSDEKLPLRRRVLACLKRKDTGV